VRHWLPLQVDSVARIQEDQQQQHQGAERPSGHGVAHELADVHGADLHLAQTKASLGSARANPGSSREARRPRVEPGIFELFRLSVSRATFTSLYRLLLRNQYVVGLSTSTVRHGVVSTCGARSSFISGSPALEPVALPATRSLALLAAGSGLRRSSHPAQSTLAAIQARGGQRTP
jgi:hypothetical protein